MKQRVMKFRAWDRETLVMGHQDHENRIEIANFRGMTNYYELSGIIGRTRFELMQFTGLTDKNKLSYVYEGDIIDTEGNILGNQYESPELLEGTTNLLIEGMGTIAWRDTEQEAAKRGLIYAE